MEQFVVVGFVVVRLLVRVNPSGCCWWALRLLVLVCAGLIVSGEISPVVVLAQEQEAPRGTDVNQATSDVGTGGALLMAAEQMVQQAIERAAPSVVAIVRVPRNESRDPASPLNFGLPGLPQPLADLFADKTIPLEFGSGVLFSDDGAILTCYHVLDDPKQYDYRVWLAVPPEPVIESDLQALPGRIRTFQRPSEAVPAVVRAGDPWTDLAVLKIDVGATPAVRFGDASKLKRGSFVVALGNPYATARDGQASASWGIVSNLQRRAQPTGSDAARQVRPAESLQEFGTLIQTDAKLSLGTSGGALVNLQGEMVGLTTSLAAVAGFESAAGYAIPIDEPTLATIQQLREGRLPAFGFLGVQPTDAGGRQGALVSSVVPGMAADNAGLRSGDVIVGVEDLPIDDAEGLFREMSRRPADSLVNLKIVSPGAVPRSVAVRLGKKRLALIRPGYSEVAEPTWRGMAVDFVSALPPDRLQRMFRTSKSDAAVVRVDPDSPAWEAGVRPGQLIFRVESQEIEHPEDFYQAVSKASGNVTLWMGGLMGEEPTKFTIPPDESP